MWWASLDKQLMESPICKCQPELIIESDASQLGWGHDARRTARVAVGQR